MLEVIRRVDEYIGLYRELLLSTEPYGELATPYNVLRGLKALGGTGPKEDMVCILYVGKNLV